MRNDDLSNWIRASLVVNAAARDALDAIKRELAIRRSTCEAKYNPRWREQPRAPKGSEDGGQWIGGGRSKPSFSAPKQRNASRTGLGGNRPPMETLLQVNPGLRANPIWTITLSPVDGFLGISDAAYAASAQAHDNMRSSLLHQITALDPSYRERASLQSGPFTRMSLAGQANIVEQLRADYAAILYRVRGETGPLQVETMRLLQRSADVHFREGLSRYDRGELEQNLPRDLAVGRHVDRASRRDLIAFYRHNGLSFGRHSQVRVNNRDHDTSTSDVTFRIPDARVGNVAFDVTLSAKRATNPQIQGFFGADAQPVAVIIVQPTSRGGAYALWRTDKGGW